MNLFDLLTDIDQERARERGPRTKLHYHKCPRPECGHIWSHRASDLKSSQEHEDGHTCQKCKVGQQSWKCDAHGNTYRY